MPRAVLAALIALTLTGCSTLHRPPAETPGIANVKLWHVVIVHLNTPGDAAARQRLVDATKTLRQIKGVQVAYAGTVIPGTRAHIDSSFDVGIVIGFANREDMAAYVNDPIHQKLVAETLKPLAKDYAIFDFTND